MRMGIVELPNVASDSAVYQDVTLPAGVAWIMLGFWYYTQFDSAPGANALQYVDITDPFNGQLDGAATAGVNSATTARGSLRSTI